MFVAFSYQLQQNLTCVHVLCNFRVDCIARSKVRANYGITTQVMLYCLPSFLIKNLLLRLESSAAHAASGFTLYLKPKALPPGAQVGALGAPASEQAFDCPACSAALSSAQVFGQAALLQAAGPRPAPEADISAASGDDDGAEAAQVALGAAPSAKLQRLLALLADVRARNQATPTRLVPQRFLQLS